MRRYHGKQVKFAVTFAISFVAQPVGPGADDGYQKQQKHDIPETGVQVKEEAV
jgi:hypothetical protein